MGSCGGGRGREGEVREGEAREREREREGEGGGEREEKERGGIEPPISSTRGGDRIPERLFRLLNGSDSFNLSGEGENASPKHRRSEGAASRGKEAEQRERSRRKRRRRSRKGDVDRRRRRRRPSPSPPCLSLFLASPSVSHRPCNSERARCHADASVGSESGRVFSKKGGEQHREQPPHSKESRAEQAKRGSSRQDWRSPPPPCGSRQLPPLRVIGSRGQGLARGVAEGPGHVPDIVLLSGVSSRGMEWGGEVKERNEVTRGGASETVPRERERIFFISLSLAVVGV